MQNCISLTFVMTMMINAFQKCNHVHGNKFICRIYLRLIAFPDAVTALTYWVRFKNVKKNIEPTWLIEQIPLLRECRINLF